MIDANTQVRLYQLAVRCGGALQRTGRVLATAESCTGGWVAKLMTDVPGSSRWFDRGFVTYTNLSKIEMLGVKEPTLEINGAVSEAVVREMAIGALERSRANISVAISGIAGPGGGSVEKPVGTVWMAWAVDGKVSLAHSSLFEGERESIRCAAVMHALDVVEELVGG